MVFPGQELQVCRADDEFLDIVSVRCLWDKERGRQVGIQSRAQVSHVDLGAISLWKAAEAMAQGDPVYWV